MQDNTWEKTHTTSLNTIMSCLSLYAKYIANTTISVAGTSHPRFLVGVRATRSLVLCVCFVVLFVILSFFFWPLCCLFFFDLRTRIVPSVSSNTTITRIIKHTLTFS
jgi:hypothetical protein